MRSTESNKSDIRTGQTASRIIHRKATVKNSGKRSVVKVKRVSDNYVDNPMGGRTFVNSTTSGYKNVYKNGVLKKIKKY